MHPVVASAGVLVIAGLLALFVVPWLIGKLRYFLQYAIMEAISGPRRVKLDQQFLLVLLIAYSFAAAYLAGLAGSSYLIGAFLGGFAFSGVPDARKCWTEVVTPVQKWLVMIFFASIGFLVPVHSIFSPKVLLYGAILTVLAFLAKLVTGFFVSPLRYFWVLGLAMVGRGELGLLLAAEAKRIGVMSDDSFGATIWAILLCTLIAPFAFRFALAKHRVELQREALP
jgi:Kef-type K+ transport system membrane component KefB